MGFVTLSFQSSRTLHHYQNMGIGDFFYSLTETVKTYTPDLTSVYSYTTSTITKVDNTVRTNIGPKLTGCMPDAESCAKIGQKVGEYLPDEEGRARIGRFAWSFGKSAAVLGVHEGVRLVPGGSFVHKAVMRSIPDEKNDDLKHKLKTMETRMEMLEKQVSASRNVKNLPEISSSDIKLNAESASSCLNSKMNSQKPEDVINIFMMKELGVNKQIVENLMVPGVGKYQK